MEDTCIASRKSSQVQGGWTFEWTTPTNPDNLVIPVIPGPFLRPKLVKALPYVVVNNNNKNSWKRIYNRNGIPDPWLEYLNWINMDNSNDKFMSKDVRMAREYQRLTHYIWDKKGLAMVQGIPDPWKLDIHCMCNEDVTRKNKRKKTKRNVKESKCNTNKSDKIDEIKEKPLESYKVFEKTEDILNESNKNLTNQDDIDEVTKRISKTKNVLEIKEPENHHKVREIGKHIESKPKKLKSKNKKNQTSEINKVEDVCCQMLCAKCPPVILIKKCNKKCCLQDGIATLPMQKDDFDSRERKTGRYLSCNGLCSNIVTCEKRSCNKNLKKSLNSKPLFSEKATLTHDENQIVKKPDEINDAVDLSSLDDEKMNYNDNCINNQSLVQTLINSENPVKKSVPQTREIYNDTADVGPTCNLFVKNVCDTESDDNHTICKKRPLNAVKNYQNVTSNLHAACSNFDGANSSRILKNCKKKNLSKDYSNTPKKIDELIVESYSETG